MEVSFIHTADIHLGRPFSDLNMLSDKINICNQACKKAFNKIIDTAISKKVDFVLIAGDSFDNDEHDLETKLTFIRNLQKLADNKIKSYIICGNHDPICLYKKYKSYFKFDPKYDGMINIVGVTTDENPAILSYNGIVNIHALSFEKDECTNPAHILSKVNTGVEKVFNIGLIHCDLGKTESKYAPCSGEDLKSLGYDYYALGHIHIPEIKEINIVYSGSPQGRTKKETGKHGCCYVEIKDKNIVKQEFIPTDFVRFNSLDIDCSNLNNRKEVFEEIISALNRQTDDVDMNLFDINLEGITKAYNDLNISGDLLEEYMESFSADEPDTAAVYRINNNTIPDIDEKELLSDTGIIGIIAKCFDGQPDINIDRIYDEVSQIHQSIYSKLGISLEAKNELINELTKNKAELIKQSKNTAKALCKEIFNSGD